MLEKIEYDPKVAKLVQRLIVQAAKLEHEIDEEQYPAPVKKPAVRAAWALKSAPWQAWHGAAYSILRSVCGSDAHPLMRSWYRYCDDCVVDCVRRGSGILQAFLVAWKAGALWSTDEAKPNDDGVVK